MSNQEQEQNVESGVKTAHVAGKTAATAAGNAVGGVVGGKVAGKVYDAVSKTGLGQTLERNVGSILARSPVGNLNKKLDDAGMIDAADRTLNGRNGNKKFGNNQGLRRNNGNLPKRENQLGANNSTDDGSSDVPNALKNPNHYQGISSRGISSSTSTTTTEQKDDSDSQEDDSADDAFGESEEKQIFAFRLKKIVIPMLLFGSCIVVIMLVLLIQILLNPIESILSIVSLNSWNDDNKTYVYENGKSKFANEEYNNFIKGSSDESQSGLIQEFQEKFGVSIDWIMLDTILEYQHLLSGNNGFYGETDNFPITEDEIRAKLNEFGDLDGITGINDSDPSRLLIIYVARFMIDNSNGYYTCDVSEEGEFYNKLIDSWLLTAYYGKNLKDTEYETRKNLVDQIYLQYNFAKEALNNGSSSGIISSKIQVHLQTCEVPYSTMINERGKQVFSNDRNINKGTSYPESFSLTDYLKGAVEGELGRGSLNDETKEGVKAFVIATLSYTLGSFNVDFYPGLLEFNFPSGNCRLVSCDVTNGCSYTNNGMQFGTAYSGTNRGGGIHQPWTPEQNAYMDQILSEVFGIVMVKKGITAETFSSGDDLTGGNYYQYVSMCGANTNCMGQEEALQDSRNGMNYVEILNKYYHNFDLINIKEGLYLESGGEFNGQIQLNEQFHYHQGDYSQSWCAGSSISSSGCALTSASIAISLLTGEKHDPLDLNKTASGFGNCSSYSSHRNDLIVKLGQKFGLTTSQIMKKDSAGVNQMLQNISEGNTVVVARIAPNGARYSTSNGHYIALVGVKMENNRQKVLVWDPGSRSSSRDNYWADFENDILKYVRSDVNAFMIFRNLK